MIDDIYNKTKIVQFVSNNINICSKINNNIIVNEFLIET